MMELNPSLQNRALDLKNLTLYDVSNFRVILPEYIKGLNEAERVIAKLMRENTELKAIRQAISKQPSDVHLELGDRIIDCEK
jgi:hypothetical protein